MRPSAREGRRASWLRGAVSGALGALVLAAAPALAAAAPPGEPRGSTGSVGAGGPSEIDRVRLAEAFRLAEECGERVWPGWSAAPFELLLVTDDREFLLRAAERPAGFERIGEDPRLGGAILARERVFPPNLLATFPAFGSEPTIVVGTAEATGTGSTQWVVKVLHEHFHQLQMSAPGYYEESDALGLSEGDDQGSWMLDFPFPYGSQAVGAVYGEVAEAVARQLSENVSAGSAGSNGSGASDGSGASGVMAAFRDRYRRLEAALSGKDFNYLSFQLWQEGIGRYVELRVAECAAAGFRPSAAFQALADFESFSSFATRLRASILDSLRAPALAEEKRVAFYDLGAGIGLLLDRSGADWKRRYLEEKFFLDAKPDVKGPAAGAVE